MSRFIGAVVIDDITIERSPVIRATYEEAQKDAHALVAHINEYPEDYEWGFGPITEWDAIVLGV
jgi:hypothetical protein